MGSLSDKINYTVNAVNAIQEALESFGIDMRDITLAQYGDIIKSLKIGKEETFQNCIYYDLKYKIHIVPLNSIILDIELISYDVNNIFYSSNVPNLLPKPIIDNVKIDIVDNIELYEDYKIPIEK